MPNIARQDYLRINIEDIANPTSGELAEIRKNIQNGVILDTLLVASDGDAEMRVLTCDRSGEVISGVYGGSIFSIDYSE